MINIKHLSKAEALRRLYNQAKPQGMGWMHYTPDPMRLEEAEKLVAKQIHFDYVRGRVLKVSLNEDEFDPSLYDRDNGPGAAQLAISAP